METLQHICERRGCSIKSGTSGGARRAKPLSHTFVSEKGYFSKRYVSTMGLLLILNKSNKQVINQFSFHTVQRANSYSTYLTYCPQPSDSNPRNFSYRNTHTCTKCVENQLIKILATAP